MAQNTNEQIWHIFQQETKEGKASIWYLACLQLASAYDPQARAFLEREDLKTMPRKERFAAIYEAFRKLDHDRLADEMEQRKKEKGGTSCEA